jgi:hypothetical protein
MAWAALVALWLQPPAARADEPPTPTAEQLRKAEQSFDAGVRSFRAKRYELAASHFEAADDAVPSARALRMAVRARDAAGHAARAATLAALGKRRHGDDAKTAKLSGETIDKYAGELHRVDVRCTPRCMVAVGERRVPGAASAKTVVYVAPGAASIRVSFAGGGRGNRDFEAHAGARSKLRFKHSAPSSEAVVPVPVAAAAPSPAPKPSAPVEREEPPRDEPAIDPEDDSSWIESPAVFVVGLVATAAVGGVTIWSGVDTLQTPGAETVREECAGQGTDCDEYQQGVIRQTRTNVLIGATAGAGVLTAVIGLFVTDWGGSDDSVALRLGPGGGMVTAAARF